MTKKHNRLQSIEDEKTEFLRKIIRYAPHVLLVVGVIFFIYLLVMEQIGLIITIAKGMGFYFFGFITSNFYEKHK